MTKVFTKEEMRKVLFDSCDALNLVNLPQHRVDFFEQAYARKNELPFDLDAMVTDEQIFDMQTLLMDVGIFFLYLWWKKNGNEFPREL